MGDQLNDTTTQVLTDTESNQHPIPEVTEGNGDGELPGEKLDSSTPAKRGRGRPRKIDSSLSPSAKRRGRPRKEVSNDADGTAAVASFATATARGRGRPRKQVSFNVDGTTAVVVSPPRRSAGRPHKQKDPLSVVATVSKAFSSGKRPGRPRSNVSGSGTSSEKGTESTVTTTKVESKTTTTTTKGGLGVEESDTTTTTTTTETTTTTTVVKTA